MFEDCSKELACQLLCCKIKKMKREGKGIGESQKIVKDS